MMTKKLASLALALVMCLSLCVPAFAMEASQPNLADSVAGIQVSEMTIGNINLVIEDYPNGDARISQITNEVTTNVSYVHRAEQYIEDISFEEGTPSSRTRNFSVEEVIRVADLRASYTTAGTITYQYYDITPGTRYLTCAYQQTSNASMYNLAGEFKSIVSFIGFVTAIMSIPAAVAGELTAEVLSWLGIGSGIVGFIIPDYWVTCNKVCVDWRLTDRGGYSTNMSGNKYVLTESSHSGDSHYDGDYFATNSYSSHNTSFALRAYEVAYNTRDSVTITWG